MVLSDAIRTRIRRDKNPIVNVLVAPEVQDAWWSPHEPR